MIRKKKHSGVIVCEPESVVSFHLHVITLKKVTTKKDVHYYLSNNAGAVVFT